MSTRRGKRIYDDCMQLKSEGKIKKLWTTNGVVNIKFKDDNKKAKKIFHILDLDEYLAEEEQEEEEYDANLTDYDEYKGCGILGRIGNKKIVSLI